MQAHSCLHPILAQASLCVAVVQAAGAGASPIFRCAITPLVAAARHFVRRRSLTLLARAPRRFAMAAVEASSATAAHGELFLYNEDWGMGAFEFGADRGSRRALVCVGGLTDGLLSMRYLPRLAGAVGEDGWRVVQPVLSSSYSGWGTASLDSDVADLDRLLGHLAERRGVAEVVLLGHSTGCQDAVRYLATGSHVSMVRGAILQAPVSDREALPLTSVGSREEFDASLGELRDIARKMIREGKGQEAMLGKGVPLRAKPRAGVFRSFARTWALGARNWTSRVPV